MLRVETDSLCIAFGARRVVDGLTCRLEWHTADDHGRVIGLMGPSGSGKTTLARAILAARYEAPNAHIRIEPAAAVIAYLPQAPVLFGHLPAGRNARLLQEAGRYRDRFDPELFDWMARALNLESVLRGRGSVERLSGGEAQRIMLLRTLSIRPDLLLLDEPASGLDPAMRAAFLIDLQDVLRRLNIGALYISHHWDEIAMLAGRVAYAETTSDLEGARTIQALPILQTSAFEQAPTTAEAFAAIHGPGCSEWPLSAHSHPGQSMGVASAAVACIPAEGGCGLPFRRGPAPYRISEHVLARLAQGERVRAAIYRRGRFLRWTELAAADLEEMKT